MRRVRREGRRVEAYYARGMLEIRPTLFLASRLAVRANQVLQRSGAAAGGGPWLAALPAFVLLDLAIWRVLRRDDRFGLAWRLALDALDVAFWTMSPSPRSGAYDLAVLIAVTLAVEAGVRLGWRGLVVPLAILLSSGAAALAVGKAVEVTGSCWITLAVGVGAAFYRYCRHLDDRAEAEHRDRLAAAARRAFLAGQNKVAMGASSAVDAIEGMVPVLGRPQPGSALWQLADGWKSHLSVSTAETATYLQVALLEWERAHNAHPDLSSLVEVRVEEGDGTTLVSAHQVRELDRALDAMDLRGEVMVRVADGDAAALPGRALFLDVGGRPLVVPAEGRAAPPPFDPTVVAYVYVGIINVANVLPAFGSLPAPAVLGLAATSAVGAAVSHRRLATDGARARIGVFWIAVAASVVIAVLDSLVRLPVGPDGDLRLGFGNGVILLSFVSGFYWRTLGHRRWALAAVIVVDIALSVMLFPARSLVTIRDVLPGLTYNLFPFFACRHLAGALDGATARHAAAMQTVDEEAERTAFIEGRESVLGLVRVARQDAMTQLRKLGPTLDRDLFEVAAHRLEEVDRRLLAIDHEPGLSSSTTTS